MTEHEPSAVWPEPGKGDLAALISGVVAGHSLQRIADATGVSASTVARRRRDPLVRRAIAEAQAEQRRQVLGRLADSRMRALDVLDELLDHEQPAIRLRAAATTLANSLRYQLAGQDEPGLDQPPPAEDPHAARMLVVHMSDDAWDAQAIPAAGEPSDGNDE